LIVVITFLLPRRHQSLGRRRLTPLVKEEFVTRPENESFMMGFFFSAANAKQLPQGKAPARKSTWLSSYRNHLNLCPLSPAELEVLREYPRELFIRLSNSPGGALLLFSPKDDGKLASALITEESTPRLVRIGDLVKST
jgi:hypothetical protein